MVIKRLSLPMQPKVDLPETPTLESLGLQQEVRKLRKENSELRQMVAAMHESQQRQNCVFA